MHYEILYLLVNFISDKKYLFEKLNNDEWLFHDIKYDFASAGHYPTHKYSSMGQATIEMQVILSIYLRINIRRLLLFL